LLAHVRARILVSDDQQQHQSGDVEKSNPRFKDIQTYKRTDGSDINLRSKNEK
jgi:hypothetical protein